MLLYSGSIGVKIPPHNEYANSNACTNRDFEFGLMKIPNLTGAIF